MPGYLWFPRSGMRHMLRTLLLLLCCTTSVLACAQRGRWGGGYFGTHVAVTTGRGGAVPPEYATWLESDVDEPPVFPGGSEALSQYFTQVPQCLPDTVSPKCRKDRKVLVWFIVEHDGSVQEAWIDRGGCEEWQWSALCAVLEMPAWTPGRRKGEVVRTRVRLPVVYNPPGEGR